MEHTRVDTQSLKWCMLGCKIMLLETTVPEWYMVSTLVVALLYCVFSVILNKQEKRKPVEGSTNIWLDVTDVWYNV